MAEPRVPQAVSPPPGLRSRVADVRPEVSDEMLESWQHIVNEVTARLAVSAGLILRVNGPDFEVLVADEHGRNPHRAGETARLDGSNIYCERVLRTGQAVTVPDARLDPALARNPDLLAHGLASYLGYPIRWPDGALFGTICVLAAGARDYSGKERAVIELLRDLIEKNLRDL